jgi:hypothetical protein
VEYPNFTGDIIPGWSSWFLFREGLTLNVSGSETEPNSSILGVPGYAVLIYQGWNQIANPFHYAVDHNGIMVREEAGLPINLTNVGNTITQQVFWTWSAGVYQAVTSLVPGSGGWIKKITPGMGIVFFPAAPGGSGGRYQGTIDTKDLERPPAPPSGGLDSPSHTVEGGSGGCFIDSAKS